MQILCKKAFVFCDTDIATDPKSGERVAVVRRKFQVSPKVTPQLVPDWIRNDGLFELAVQDGSITEVVVVSKMIDRDEKPQPVADSGAPKTPSTATTFVTDAGAEALDQPKDEPKNMGWGAQVPTGLNK